MLDLFTNNPFLRLAVYVGFAAVFFHSGLALTTWLVSPEQMGGAIDVVLALLFPVLLPAFFVVNRHFGCGSGGCAGGACTLSEAQGPVADSPRSVRRS